jgi:hypothetical protein
MKDADEIVTKLGRETGYEALRHLIDGEALLPKLSSSGWALKIGCMPQFDYASQRKDIAGRLGWRVKDLDDLRRLGLQMVGVGDGDGDAKSDDRAGLLDKLVGIAIEHDLFADDGAEAYVCVTLEDGGRRTYRCRTAAFVDWLRTSFGDRYPQEIAGQTVPGTVSTATLTDAVAMIAALARRGEVRPVFLRFGWTDDALYLDLGTPEPRALEITPTNWSIVKDPPVHLIYTPTAKPLPVPEPGVNKRAVFKRLARLFGFKPADDRFVLLLGILMAGLLPRGPYPVAVFIGEQGSGKSSRSKLIKAVLDPTKVSLRGAPQSSEDLIISTWRSWFAIFDNLSKLDQRMSDWLCRLSEGGGISKRTLYTDLDETLVEAARPILINAIPDICQSGDLIDRSVFIRCEALPMQIRERVYLQEIESLAPALLGLLIEAAGCALGRFDQMAESYPGLRRSDWAAWVEAAAPALGLKPGRFEAAYRRNQEDAVRLALELDPLARAVVGLLDELGFTNGGAAEWEGEATVLHDRLTEKARTQYANNRLPLGWPALTHHFVGRLRRLAPQLRRVGVEFGQRKDDRTRRSVVQLSKCISRAQMHQSGTAKPSGAWGG